MEQAQDPVAQDPVVQDPVAEDPVAQDPIAQDDDQPTPDPTLNEDQDPPQVAPPEVAEESPELYKGFSEDPFVRATAMFRDQEYLGIVELLTEAVETGVKVGVWD